MSEMKRIAGNSPEAKSLDIKQQNIENLRQLFPDVFSENKIDFEALRAVLGEEIDDSEERYNFTWNGKTKARKIAQTPSTGTLRPSKEESVNWDKTENLFIEGDNLEVLKLLQKSYYKQVKMIYIDPPYNTGKDFVYQDDFKDNVQNYLEQTSQVDKEGKKLSTNFETSGRYHSDWLNMMYPRLKLARNLLKKEGLIFISIDDNEISNMRSMCDEVFGEDNLVTQVVWQRAYAPVNMNKYFSPNHDHILVYAKDIFSLETFKLQRTEKQLKDYKNPDNDLRGPWKVGNPSVGPAVEKNIYPITLPNGNTVLPPNGRSWLYSEQKYNELILDNRIYFSTSGNGSWAPKLFLSEVSQGVVPLTLWEYKDVGHSQDATKEVKALMGGKSYFSYPKPISLMERIIQIGSGKDGDIILDFFAGSATTAHAVMKKSIDDGIKRKFIMVQLPEPIKNGSDAYKDGYLNLSQLSRQRIKNAILKLERADSTLGFKSYYLDQTNIRSWDADFDNLESVLRAATESIKSDRSNEDVLYEILLKYGIELTVPIETEVVNGKQVFVVGAGALIVCLDDGITSEVVEGIAKLKDELDPETTQVVFKDAGFADSNVKTNAIQILKQAGVDDVKSI